MQRGVRRFLNTVTVSMKSGLEDRNNHYRVFHIGDLTEVSMKSGLEDRNNGWRPVQAAEHILQSQ